MPIFEDDRKLENATSEWLGPNGSTPTTSPVQPTNNGQAASYNSFTDIGGPQSVPQPVNRTGFRIGDLSNNNNTRSPLQLTPSNDGSRNKAATTDPSTWTWFQAMAYAKQNYQTGVWTPEQSVTVVDDLFRLRSTPGNRFYNPFAQGNQTTAMSYLRGVTVDGEPLLGKNEEISPEWITTHAWLMDFLKISDAGNALGPTQNDAKNGRTPKSNSAYYLNQMLNNGSVENSMKADDEWEALQADVAYWVSRTDLNLSDDEIIKKLNIEKNYPTLAKLKADSEAASIALAAGLTPVKLAWGSDYSEESIHGLIWASRNGGYKDNGTMLDWMTGYYLGEGNQYAENPVLSARLTFGSGSYNPYAVCATMDKELQLFGRQTFPRGWTDANPQYANDDKYKKAFDNVVDAEEFTVKAEDQYAKLMEQVDKWIENGKKPEDIIKKVDKLLEGSDYNALQRIDNSLKKSDLSLIPTTRPIPYSYGDVVDYINEKCGVKAEADREGRLDAAETVGDLTGEVMPAGPTNEEVDAARTATDAVLGENGTEEERNITRLADETFDVTVTEFGKALAPTSNDPLAEFRTVEQNTTRFFEANPRFLEITAPVAQYRGWERQKNEFIETLKNKWGITYDDNSSTRLADSNWAKKTTAQKVAVAEALFPVEKVEGQEDTYRLYTVNPDGSKSYNTERITGTETVSGEGLIRMVEDAEIYGRTWNQIPLGAVWKLANAKLPETDDDAAKEIFGLYADIYDCDNHMDILRGKFNDDGAKLYDEGLRMMQNASDAYSALQLGPNSEQYNGAYLWDDAINMMLDLSVYNPTDWLPYDDFTYYIEAGIVKAKQDGTYHPAHTRGELEIKARQAADWTVKEYSDRITQMDKLLKFLEDSGVVIPEGRDSIMENYNREIARMQRTVDQAKTFLLGYNEDFKGDVSAAKARMQSSDVPYDVSIAGLQNEYTVDGAAAGNTWAMYILNSPDVDKSGHTKLDYYIYNGYGYEPDYRLSREGLMLTELMTDDERDRYFYIRENNGIEEARHYIETLIDPTYGILVTRAAQDEKTKTAAFSNGGPLNATVATLGSFATSQMQLMGLGYAISQWIKGEEINPNSPWFSPSRFTTVSRSTVAQNIKGNGEDAGRNFLVMLYNAGTSAVDSYNSFKIGSAFFPWIGVLQQKAQVAATPLERWLWEAASNYAGAALMSANAAGTGGMSAKERRGSDTQAMDMAGWTFFWESITEAIEISALRRGKAAASNLFSNGNWKTAAGWKAFAADAGWSAATEFTGEGINSVGEAWSEYDTMLDKSEYWINRRLAAEIYGIGNDAANISAMGAVGREAFEEAVTGGLSGLLMFFGGAGANSVAESRADRATGGQSVIDRITAELGTDNALMNNMLARLAKYETRIANRTAQNVGEGNQGQNATARDASKAARMRASILELQQEMMDKRGQLIPLVAARNGIDVRMFEEVFHQNDLMNAVAAAEQADADYKAQPTERNRMRAIEANDAVKNTQREIADFVKENGPLSRDSANAIYQRTGEWYGDPSVPESERGQQAKPQAEEAPVEPTEETEQPEAPIIGVTPNGTEAHTNQELLDALAEEKGQELDRLNENRNSMPDEDYNSAVQELDRKYDAERATKTGVTPGGQELTGEQLAEALRAEYEQALKDLEASMHGKGPHMSLKQYQKAREKLGRTYSEENAYKRKTAREAEAAQLAEEEARRQEEIARAEEKRAQQAAEEAQPEEEAPKTETELYDPRGQKIPGDAIGATPDGKYANTPYGLYAALDAEKTRALELLADMENRGTVSKWFAQSMRERYEQLYSYQNARARIAAERMAAEARQRGNETESAPAKHGPYFVDGKSTFKPELYRFGLTAALMDLDLLMTTNQAQAAAATGNMIQAMMAMRRMGADLQGMNANTYKSTNAEISRLFAVATNANRVLSMVDDMSLLAMDIMNNGAENASADKLNKLFNQLTGLRDTYVEGIAKEGLLKQEDMANMTITEALNARAKALAAKMQQMAEESQKAPEQPAPAPRDENGFDLTDPVLSEGQQQGEEQQGDKDATPPANTDTEGEKAEAPKNEEAGEDTADNAAKNTDNASEEAENNPPANEEEKKAPPQNTDENSEEKPGFRVARYGQNQNADTRLGQDIAEGVEGTQPAPVAERESEPAKGEKHVPGPKEIAKPKNDVRPSDTPVSEPGTEEVQKPENPKNPEELPENPAPEETAPKTGEKANEDVPEAPANNDDVVNPPTDDTGDGKLILRSQLLLDGIQNAGDSTQAAFIASLLANTERGDLDADMAAAAAMKLASTYGDAKTAAAVVQGATSVASNRNNVQRAFQIGSLYSGGLSEQALRALTPTPSATAVDNLVKAAYLDSKNADYSAKIGEAMKDYAVARELQKVAQQNPELVNKVRNAQQAYDSAVANERTARQDLDQLQQELNQLQNQLVSAGAQMASDSGGTSGSTNAAVLAAAAGDVVAKGRQVTQYQQAYGNARLRTQAAAAQLQMATEGVYQQAKQAAEQAVIQRTADRAQQKLNEQAARAEAVAQEAQRQEEAARQAENERDGQNLDEMDWNEYARQNGKDVNNEEQKQRFLEKARQNRENNATANPAQQTAPGEMTDAKKQLVEKIAQSYGIQVKWVDSILEGKANGAYDGGNTIYLSKSLKNDQALQQVFFHELTHSAEGTRAYRNLIAMVIDLAFDGNAQKYNQFVDRRMAAYNNILRSSGKSIDRTQAARELVADLMPQILFADQEQADRFAERRPTMVSYLTQRLKEFIAKLRGVRTEGKAQLMRAQLTYERALQKAERARQKRMDENAHPLSELFHIETLMEASDLIPVRDASGQVIYLADLNGNRVNEITAENMDNSPMGRLTRTAVKNGTLTEEGRDNIMKTMASLATLIMKVNDVDSVWEITGAFFTSPTQALPWEWTGDPTFSAVKSNSDPQYSSTIDFGTVCARTQQLIDVLSQTMVAEGRGLTRNEVLRAYQMVATEHVTEEYAKAHPEMRDENGNPKRLQITCPVCYVFSRWIGVPSLLNTIGQYQRQFLNMTDQQLTDWVNNTQSRFLDENGVFNKDKLDAEKTKLKNKLNKLLENVDNYMREHRMSENLESDPEFNDLMDRMEKAQADFDALNAYAYVTQVALEWARNGNETYLVAYDQNGKRVSKPGPNTLYHRDRSVNIVPNEILFDMNRGGDFARLYPKTWSFRTTRGAGMGKAVMPFGGWRIGDVVYGAQTGGARVGATRTRVNPLTGQAEQVLLSDKKDNYFLRNANGKYVYENRMRDALKNASRRQRAQNLIGGQRLQSTSDFRAEWGLDYVLAMMELQALHSKTQMYTKVLDAVPFLASMGNEVNMSAMSNGLGYRTNADGSQELALSSITGVDPTMGYRFQHMYDNAQMILVGLNDTHIRLALQNSEDLNNDIMFVIPWHSSGNSIAMLDMMMNAIGAEGTSAHQDYTVYENDEDVQGFIDKALKGEYKAYAENGGTMTRGQYYADRLGKLGFTEFGFNVKGTVEEGGLDRLAELVDSKADFKVVPTALQQARRDARYKIVNGTYMAKGKDRKPFTAADMAAIESSAYLQRLYDRFCVDKNSDAYQVSFAAATAEKIFPHEYWDKSADYWHARVNGDNFVEYCREMGLVPRFSQFTDEDGYWKLLIDRRMFDRQGNYREQGYVDVTEAATRLLPMTVNEATYGDTEATARAVEHVRFGRENADGTFTPSAVADWNAVLASMNGTETEMNGDALVYSLPVEDQETLDFLNEQEARGEVIRTFRTMKLLGGKLVSPKASYINGKIEGDTQLGQWEMATEHPELVKFKKNGEAYFGLDEKAGRKTEARYNPYMHSSNLMINDQFLAAYEYSDENSPLGRFVTVECLVPASEATSGYKAQYAKDPVGWTDWKAGGVAAELAKQGKTPRRVFLSRWIKNVRIVPDAEVAQHYKNLLAGTDIEVPANVVTPSLRAELEKAGVKLGTPTPQQRSKFERETGLKYSLDLAEARDNLQAMLDPEQANLEDVSTDTGDVIDDSEFSLGTGEEQYIQNGIVNDQAFEDELMDSWIRNPDSRQPIAPARNAARDNAAGTLADRSRASYNRNANPNEANNNKDHAQRMQSPQYIAKRLARSLNIGAAIGTKNMNGMSPATRGYYTQRARAIGIRNTSANSFVTGMHELGHGVSERINVVGTPEMIARLPADFAANYSAAELPYEAFAEFFWQYMTQDNKAVPFAGQAFVDDVEQKMKDAGIWNDVQKARDGLMLWIEGSTSDRIGSVIHDRSEGQKMPIKDWFRSMVDQVTDATYAAERVNAMIREQTGQKTLPIAEDLRQMARMKNFAARQAFNILANNLIDPNGTIIGDSLGDRFTAAGFRATDQNIDLLIRYMLALHSLNRDAEGKPVFDEHITPRARQDFIDDVQNNHPEIARAEEAFQAFRKDFLKAWMVDTGFMTQDAFDLFNKIYPHYVPTLRVKDARYHDQNQQGGRRYTVRRAVGSTEDIWNPMDSFVGMVNSIVNMVSANRVALAWENAYRNYDGMGVFGREITEDIEATQVDLSDLSRKIENILDTEVEDDVLQDVLDLMQDGLTNFRRTNNTTMPNGIMVQHADGTRSFFEMFDTELYKLLASVQENTHNPIFESIGRLTHMMAGLTTGSNPIFAARNFMRDFQTSVNYGSWASNYGTGFAKWLVAAYEVWKSSSPIASKVGLKPEKAYEEYTALGGGGWTRIQADTKQGADEYRQGIFQHGYNTRNVGSTARFLGQKLWNTLSFARLNEIVEQTSRYAEYRFGKHDRSTPEGRMEAFLAAQDATVDFARKGNGAVAQTLKQLIPFFGASMQGVARTARSVTESERARTPIRFLKTVINTGLLSALASLLLYANSDDDEKEEFVRMSNSLKAMHFYFPNFAPEILGEAPLIRVPVGQDPLMYAIHGAVTDAIWNGIGDSPAIDFATIAATVLDVCNPFGNGTIFEAALGVMRNETYYGSRIIPASLDNQDPSNQYSDDTPDVFIGLGRMTGVSPNVLQYLAEQYTGFLGQIAIPALSKTEGGNAGGLKAVRDAIRKKFTSDPLTSNDVLDSFYDGRAFLNSVKAAGDSGRPLNMLRRGLDELDAEDAYDEAVSLLSTKGTVGATAKEITKYSAQISEIMADSTMTDHEKAVEVRRIRREMIEMVLDAQEEIGEYKAQYFTGYDPIFSRFIPGTIIEPQK